MYICLRIHICICIGTYIYETFTRRDYTENICRKVSIYMCIYIYIYTYGYIYIYICMYIYIYAYVHAHTYMTPSLDETIRRPSVEKRTFVTGAVWPCIMSMRGSSSEGLFIQRIQGIRIHPSCFVCLLVSVIGLIYRSLLKLISCSNVFIQRI